MLKQPIPTQANALGDHAADAADSAIKATRRMTDEALDGLAGSVEHARLDAGPLLDRAGEQVGALAQRGVGAMREGSQQLRDRALRAGDSTVTYIKDEPVKAMLMAAAAGAAVMALVALLSRSRS